jgi:hypothetical protein
MSTAAQSARGIFLAAVDLDGPEQRAGYLEVACAGDPVMLRCGECVPLN